MNVGAEEVVDTVSADETPVNPDAVILAEQVTVMEGRVKCTHPGCLRNFKKLKGMQNHLATHANLRNILCHFCGKGFNVYGPRNLHEKLYCKLRPEPAENVPAKGEKRKALEDGPEAKKQRTDSPAAAPSPGCASPALPSSARFDPRPFSPLALPQKSQFSSPPSQQYGWNPQPSQYYVAPQQNLQWPAQFLQHYGWNPQPSQHYVAPQQNSQWPAQFSQQYYSSPQQQQYYSSPEQQQSQHYSSPQQQQYSSTSQHQQSFVSAYHPQSIFYQPQSSYGRFASNGSAQLPEPTEPSYATLQPIVSVSNPLPSDLCTTLPSSYSITDSSVEQQPQLAAASDEPSLEKILLDVLASDSHDESTDSWLYKPNHL